MKVQGYLLRYYMHRSSKFLIRVKAFERFDIKTMEDNILFIESEA